MRGELLFSSRKTHLAHSHISYPRTIAHARSPPPPLQPNTSSTVTCPLAPPPLSSAANPSSISSHRNVCDDCIKKLIYYQNLSPLPKHRLGYTCPYCRLVCNVPRYFAEDIVFPVTLSSDSGEFEDESGFAVDEDEEGPSGAPEHASILTD